MLVLLVVYDGNWSDTRLFDPRAKDTGLETALRLVVLGVGSAMTVIGSRELAIRHLDPIEVPHRAVGPRVVIPTTVFAVLVTAGTALLVLIDPDTLTWLATEDRPVEWASALFAFAAGFVTLAAARSYWQSRRQRPGRGVSTLALLGLAGVMFLLGLEEVSWFQRVFDVETPERLLAAGNAQGELNLHNFATSASGNAYYVGAFSFALLWPYLLGDRELPRKLSWTSDIVPHPLVLLVSAPALALSFEKWDVFWINAMLWGGLVMVATIAIGSGKAIEGPRWVQPLVGAAVVTTLVVLATWGDRMTRSWDESEVRELVIPFGFLLYAILVADRASGTKPRSARQ